MNHEHPYWVIAFYTFTPIDDPHAEVALHKAFFADKDATARIYISLQGINGQLCLSKTAAQAYIDWMHARKGFANIHFKIEGYHEHVFPRLTIKYRKQLVALDADVNIGTRGEPVSPERWKEMLENQENKVLLDVRNEYEWKLGHFAGAVLPPCDTFRDFREYAEGLKEKVDPTKTPVMMYCTGGIRCELYSSILKEKGFDQVYQLDGGIIHYGQAQGSDHWLGKLFVFDDRLAVPVGNEKTPVVGVCHFCKTSCESYYNCANMDCNKLFLCCQTCLFEHHGCCQTACACVETDKLRPVKHQNPHKPFRKWHTYFPKKARQKSPEQIERAKAKRLRRKLKKLNTLQAIANEGC